MAQAAELATGAGMANPPPLKISRTLHARRETAFKAWASADSVARWFAPSVLTVPHATVDMRVGGAFEVCMRMPDGTEHWTRGVFTEVKPFTRLVIDMRAEDQDGAPLFRALTELGFSDAPGGTLLEVTQTYTFANPAAAAPMVAGASAGWTSTLEKLDAEVMRLQAAAAPQGTHSVVHATFHLERTYNAPVARVWKALTDEQAKQKWFGRGPTSSELIDRHMDVRVGGRERLKVRWDGGVVSCFDAFYHDVVPNERLVYTYEMHMDDRKISVSLATMQLKAAGGKTTLMVTEQGAFLDGYDDAGAREHGTGLLLDGLGASLAD